MRVPWLIVVLAAPAYGEPARAPKTTAVELHADAKHHVWTSGPVSLAVATRAWNELVDQPGFVPVIAERLPELDDDPAGAAPARTLAQTWAALRKERDEEIAELVAAIAKANDVSADDKKAIANQRAMWDRARIHATVDADDLKDAAHLVAFDSTGINPFDNKRIDYYVVAYEGTADRALGNARGSDLSPTGDELAPVLAYWHKKYGARLFSWDGYNWTLDVPHPPKQLAELRALAAELALACPYDRSGRGPITQQEEPSHAMARLEQTRWVCWWFEE